ncbi:alkanesulfonate monooxygenase SsuD/methylene tetrahydromethanopterin reductase-like flavin-dependent oxidoreductase (luciferase family) [Conyzicola lurida]|uniref:Alkanesulfonate monooxygenase SsuD/methylene tetrahydromethanopterin reductase-like flavin-dependent oxidoreductase (Luciferase family) n=1 Tax=Conyzicola lurida TaxID=1172621 RepID=A0A841ANR1_9MICO|nr:LLM class flavin-dependent oxidoreductase [Conyzicola lurida]MBB5843185.1 alkanesulfonate monooxygenase SsuD/methylene tetrahydromethanopterin reductase-like flavin-dependent oxidoreductase (luciferase family) [Conyzicola lurida]
MLNDRATGVMLPRDLPASRFAEFARSAEDLGFDELWVVEDCFFRGGIAQAAVALAVTSRIHVGIGILPAAARNAAFATLDAATLAELFPGRTTIGVGHGMPGWMRQVGAWPASPLTLLEETVDAMKGLLAGARVSTEGRYVRLRDVALETPPQAPPLVLAGVRGPKSLALSGRVADGTVLAEPVTPEYLATALAQIAPAGGHRVVAYNVGAVHPDPAIARDTARSALGWIGEPDWRPHIEPLPFAAEFAALRASVASPEEFGAALPDEWVDRLAVVGTAEAARARRDELFAAGAHSVVLIPAGPDPFAALDGLAALL